MTKDIVYINTVVYDPTSNRFYVDNDFGRAPIFDVGAGVDRHPQDTAEIGISEATELFVADALTKASESESDKSPAAAKAKASDD